MEIIEIGQYANAVNELQVEKWRKERVKVRSGFPIGFNGVTRLLLNGIRNMYLLTKRQLAK